MKNIINRISLLLFWNRGLLFDEVNHNFCEELTEQNNDDTPRGRGLTCAKIPLRARHHVLLEAGCFVGGKHENPRSKDGNQIAEIEEPRSIKFRGCFEPQHRVSLYVRHSDFSKWTVTGTFTHETLRHHQGSPSTAYARAAQCTMLLGKNTGSL